MSDLTFGPSSHADAAIGQVSKRFERRVRATPPGVCPLTQQLAFLQTSVQQCCSKCVPCREGLPRLSQMLADVVACRAGEDDLARMRELAVFVRDGSDCAIGYQAAQDVLDGMDEFSDEYASHVQRHRCAADVGQSVPCETMCPAHVDVPAYIALVGKGDNAGAVAMVRKDNPFPTACAYICEHPCEARCRRVLVDDAINIRGVKKYACDHAPTDKVPVPEACPATGRTVAVVGAGPSGLTCAYFAALMGHHVDVYEAHERLGGMMRYGIPAFRFPREKLEQDLSAVLSAGDIQAHTGTSVDGAMLKRLSADHDAVYVAVGAQLGRPLPVEGADAEGVMSAVELLGRIGDGDVPDFSGLRVAVVGGGNVAMDCCRTAVRLGAKSVVVAYRRRVQDMTALPEEVQAAREEGVEMLELQSPDSLEVDEHGHVAALVTRPQMIGVVRRGRPAPVDADAPKRRIPADAVLVAVGQGADVEPLEKAGLVAERGRFAATPQLRATDADGRPLGNVFVGGDCQTGPKTVIQAVGAGRVAAHNIDEMLGYHHRLDPGVRAPMPAPNWREPCGRVEVPQRQPHERACDWDCVELGMSEQEVLQEAKRCLRCDHYGAGACVGGRRQYV